MLIDEFLPRFDKVERHGLVIRATPARVWTGLGLIRHAMLRAIRRAAERARIGEGPC